MHLFVYVKKKLYLCAKFGAERRNTMEELQEVGNSRLAEYKAIEKEVDAEAERLTREELGMPEDQWWFGSCHTFWKHKKRILREKYHMRWRSPQDINPTTCFD
jgi:hypothetical protein